MKSEEDVKKEITECFDLSHKLHLKSMEEDIHDIDSPTMEMLDSVKGRIKALWWVLGYDYKNSTKEKIF